MPNQRGQIEWWELVPLAPDPSRLPKLPTEVWERILDIIDCDIFPFDSFGDRNGTFAACCLATRFWLPRSRYHLYQHVTVRSKEQVKEVSKMLRSIPALRTRVEQLDVYGSNDGKTDASWIGLVGLHLGPKLKALRTIQLNNVNFSLMKIEAYKFWGAFNRPRQPDAALGLNLWGCTVTHINQPIRLALVTKAKHLNLFLIPPNKQAESAPPAPPLPSGISLPLFKFVINQPTSDLVLSMPWHTLAKQCPSLFDVEIWREDENLDASSPNCRLFLVSILSMFNRMQRRNDTSYVTLWTGSLPTIVMRTKPYDKSANAEDTPLATQPRLHRELALGDGNPSWGVDSPVESFANVLALLEDTMVLANYTNRRFHLIQIFGVENINDLQPDSFRSLDRVLSRLNVATHDVHVVIEQERQPYELGCVVPWARERFPMLTAIVPNAFCDPDAGQPCDSHPRPENRAEQG